MRWTVSICFWHSKPLLLDIEANTIMDALMQATNAITTDKEDIYCIEIEEE